MKKIIFMLIMFIIPITVKADHIYNIDMDIYIDKFGNAEITEVWDVKADGGSEWYKTMYDLDGSNLFDFVVYMDGEELNRKFFWKVGESLSQKSGYYGVVRKNEGLELCFGKSDMKRHIFTLKYKLSNYIFNTDDSQVLYWTLIPKIKVDKFTVDLTSYYEFPNNLEVWGYGYKGYAYVKDGKISMSNEKKLNNKYVVLLVKFPLNTFETEFKIMKYNNFEDVYNQANKGSFKYNNIFNNLFVILKNFFFFLLVIIIAWPSLVWNVIVKIFKSIKNKFYSQYGYIENKKIKKGNVLMFRDIPCDKDIYYANILIKLNNFNYKETNIFGAIILKWIKNNIISYKKLDSEYLKDNNCVIDLTGKPVFDNDLETELFDIMYKASNDGYLNIFEFENWCRDNYSKFLGLFNKIENNTISKLKKDSLIRKRKNKKECRKKMILADKIYFDSIELYGLKKYLEEFSRINTKEVMEVKLWEEYMIFAYLFGIADKVVKQLKNMYPEVIEQINFDYDMIGYISLISNNSIRAVKSSKNRYEFSESVRKSAKSYSFGGGGFSSGGGGGGSRGGGGGGSAGGR